MTLTATAQTRVFSGRVTDEKKNGIPFAIIEAREQRQGVYTDENGYFAFTADTTVVKTLAVFSMGYAQRQLQVALLPADSLHITLTPQATTLGTVKITARKGKKREGILGHSRRKLPYHGKLFRNYGAETAIKLRADTGRYNATLREVYVYISPEGEPTTKFRVHVYEWDDLPKREITDTNVVVAARKGGTWVKVDLSSRKIPVGEGLFVSVEWVAGFGNTQIPLQSTSDSAVVGFNGQVLGITDGYGQASITYSRKPFSSEWQYYDDPRAMRRGGYFLNPMIYCTYIYQN
jgi:hypothetical protein